jgi:hypothetical protein
MKRVFAIYTCAKTAHRCNHLLDTWVQDLIKNNISFFFISGDQLTNLPNFLHLENFKECYEQLPLKTYYALQKLLQQTDFTHVVKVNDDTYVNVEKFLQLNLDPIKYAGKQNEPSHTPTYHYYKIKNKSFHVHKRDAKNAYAEGGFYILNNETAKIIVNNNATIFYNTPETYKGEDVLIGEILKTYGVELVDLKDPASGDANMDITNQGLSFHPVHYSLMPLIHTKSFKEQLAILVENSLKNDYNRIELFQNEAAKQNSLPSSSCR